MRAAGVRAPAPGRPAGPREIQIEYSAGHRERDRPPRSIDRRARPSGYGERARARTAHGPLPHVEPHGPAHATPTAGPETAAVRGAVAGTL